MEDLLLSLGNVLMMSYILIGIMAAAFGLVAIRNIASQQKHTRVKNWLVWVFTLIVAGLACWVLGELLWIVLDSSGLAAYPSVADYAYITGYLLYLAGLAIIGYQLVKARGLASVNWRAVTALVIGSLATYWLIASLIIGHTAAAWTMESALDYAYPLLSFFLLVAAAYTYEAFKGGPIDLPFKLILIGFVANYVADFMFTYYTWNGIYGFPGILSDLLYFANYSLNMAAMFLFMKQSGRAK